MTWIPIPISRNSSICCKPPSMRRQPRWMILTGLIHDLGKVLCLWGEPQWAVVGDTFATGCAFSPKNVFPQFLADNPEGKITRSGKRLTASTNPAAASTKSSSPGATTNIGTAAPSPTKPSTCCATTAFIRKDAKGPTTSSATRRIAR